MTTICNRRFRTVHLARTSSTNDEVKRAIAAGEAEGLVVHADEQTGGYGRQGRTWASPKGGLYASFLLRPDVPVCQLPTLALAASVAVTRVLRDVVGEEQAARIGVKWPNDVLLDGADLRPQKLCGISCEAIGGAVCVGIGINVTRPREECDECDECEDATASSAGSNRMHGDAPAAGAHPKAYLEELNAGASVEEVLDALLRAFEETYDQWLAAGFDALCDEYRAYHVLVGRDVSLVDLAGNECVAGTVQSVDADGRLVVRDAAGACHQVSSGEVHVVW